eukprot:13455626-Ditylum_brightwellii.AAC.2
MRRNLCGSQLDGAVPELDWGRETESGQSCGLDQSLAGRCWGRTWGGNLVQDTNVGQIRTIREVPGMEPER